jgi:hypothetical protein
VAATKSSAPVHLRHSHHRSRQTRHRAHGHRFSLGPLERCIIFHESSGERDASNGSDFSYYQWSPATYNDAARMAGVPERANPEEADLEEQTLAFRAYEPEHPEAWETMPLCGGP